MNNINNKKVLLVGLGILGGGRALAKFFLKQKAHLTITDLRNEKILDQTIKNLSNQKIKFILGKHRQKDFKDNEIIVFNSAVNILSPWVALAKKLNKQIYNDLSLFLEILKKTKKEYIAITGTRGKTTTANWINHFLPGAVIGGNMPNKGLLDIINSKTKLFVLELSSFQLEFMKKNLKPPKIAVITNLYRDHLNRHKTMKNYFKIKAQIFLNQTENDYLILNADDKYTREFFKEKPKGEIYYFSMKKLSENENGLFFRDNNIFFQENNKKKLILKNVNLANHQKANLAAALLVARLYGKQWKDLIPKIKSLRIIPFREETIFKNKNFAIINDAASTSPEAAIVALERFGKIKNKLIFITGGTDKQLKFDGLADKIKKHVNSKNLFFLEGSATKKIIKELKRKKYFKKNNINIFKNLKEILMAVKNISRKGTMLFSPASASFEKFNNEFDRGREFNKLVKSFFYN